ncbi:glycosyltransferase [Arthrobacter sp. W4I7]|uniref:glycosyltransferase n=1 Tax=Arthrobacter sp. W4I7 TaxID=3042296 RepID=UPI0027D876E7|nr:glycosyltransferase [Arthrobacter sp. W4I7]
MYVNSFFDPKYSIFPQMLFLMRILQPRIFVIAPRGEFSAGALKIKAVKKQTYIRLFKLLGLRSRVLWHASSTLEADNIRAAAGDDAEIVVRENDTLLPPIADRPRAQVHPGVLKAVFLSRLSPKKGLLTLLRGLQSVSEPLVLDVIGPAEDKDYFDQCSAAAVTVPSSVTINFLGPRNPDDIRTTLADYDVFLFPTEGENFGHVIAEALSVSCPVLCADVTPWSEILASGGGQVVADNTPDGWARMIECYARLTHQERLERRFKAGKAYNAWKSNSSEPHFFTLLEKLISA